MIILIIVIVIFVFFILVVIGSISQAIKPNNYQFKVTNTFLKKHNPIVGEEVIFWLNENEDKISIFLRGTGGADGRIGYVENRSLIKDMKNDVDFVGRISSIENNVITISITTQ